MTRKTVSALFEPRFQKFQTSQQTTSQCLQKSYPVITAKKTQRPAKPQKHQMAVHKIHSVKIDYICGRCELPNKSLPVIWEHVVECQKTIDESEERRICLYDMNVFQNDCTWSASMGFV